MTWQQISVVTDQATAPRLSDLFSDLGAASVTYLDAEDEPVYEPAIGETVIWTRTQVVALFDEDVDLAAIDRRVRDHFSKEALTDWQCERVEDQEWERAWMDHYRPMKFAERLWVCPTGQEVFEPGTVCLTLDPGLAFGTGTHPTTALCLEWLASHDLAGKRVIDYGCGSGILTVAAVLLGARSALAVDIDPQALTATQDNAAKNRVQDRIHCYLPEALPSLPADLVLANILAKPLCELNDRLCSLLNPQGQLVLSGILADQAETVRACYRQRVVFSEPVQREDWIRLAGCKN